MSRIVALSLCASVSLGLWGPLAAAQEPTNLGEPPPIEDSSPPAEEATLAPPPPDNEASLDRFRAVLSPYGRWITVEPHGHVWVPNVAAGWRPYTNGEWAYTEQGWTFAALEPWGWAPFHYGRWMWIGGSGWAWVPGYKWAPAWVAWRYGGDYIAWAPLGPVGVADAYYNAPSVWVAVRGPNFYGRLGRAHFVPTAAFGAVMQRTHFVGHPRAGRYMSPPARFVSQVVRRPIIRVQGAQIAPRWVRSGKFDSRARVERAYRSGRVVEPTRVWQRRSPPINTRYIAPARRGPPAKAIRRSNRRD